MRIGIRRQVEKAGRKEFEEYYGGTGSIDTQQAWLGYKKCLEQVDRKKGRGMEPGNDWDASWTSCGWLCEEL